MFSSGRPTGAQVYLLCRLFAVLAAANPASTKWLVEAPFNGDPAGCHTGAQLSVLWRLLAVSVAADRANRSEHLRHDMVCIRVGANLRSDERPLSVVRSFRGGRSVKRKWLVDVPF